jgi:serine protease Do
LNTFGYARFKVARQALGAVGETNRVTIGSKLDRKVNLMNANLKRWLGVMLVIAQVTGLGYAGWGASQKNNGQKGEDRQNPEPKLRVDASPLPENLKANHSFAPVVKRVSPSVVNIYSTVIIKDRPGMGMHPFFNDPMFRQFFGDEFGGRQQRPRKEQSLGSGVIVSPDGYILTAAHVVEGADSVKVALESGEEEIDAKIIGTDPPTDIAVLKIEPRKQLPALPLGDSDKLEVGDMVIAVGNPFGLSQTVTMGIVSGLKRGGMRITDYENFIQTDAAINQGNSGGALVDVAGRLIGINTAILSRSGGNMGVGFAVPVNMARYVMERLVKFGKVARGYLGINIQPLTPDLVRAFNLPDESSGVLVGGVTPDSAAAKAGIKDGDVILEVDGKKVSDPRNLQLVVAQTPPGSKVAVKVLRAGSGDKPVEKTFHATLGELPQEALASMDRGDSRRGGQSRSDALDGVEVADLDARARRQFDIPSNIRGAVVVNVDQDSKSAEAGLRPGDVIMEINRQAVRDADEAVKLSENVKGDRVLLRVWSRAGGGPGGTRYIVVDNSKRE